MLRVERDGTTVIWTIDRPEAKNAIDGAVFAALERAIDAVGEDAGVRAIVLTGAGGSFASGGDLRQLRERTTADDARALSETGARICARIESLSVPVIAAIDGVAFGGGAELAMACDLCVAAPDARVAFKQVRLAVTTAWGALSRLVARVGQGTAARLLFTGQEIGAVEARVIGLVDAVTDASAGSSFATALAWANDVAAGAPGAVTAMKELLRAARFSTRRELDALERERFVSTWSSADHREAVEAFFARRAPQWSA